ncbi:MAG: hypothetical protein WA823_21415, partial [Candidatus Acidiferrales bacterium]
LTIEKFDVRVAAVCCAAPGPAKTSPAIIAARHNTEPRSVTIESARNLNIVSPVEIKLNL